MRINLGYALFLVCKFLCEDDVTKGNDPPVLSKGFCKHQVPLLKSS